MEVKDRNIELKYWVAQAVDLHSEGNRLMQLESDLYDE